MRFLAYARNNSNGHSERNEVKWRISRQTYVLIRFLAYASEWQTSQYFTVRCHSDDRREEESPATRYCPRQSLSCWAYAKHLSTQESSERFGQADFLRHSIKWKFVFPFALVCSKIPRQAYALTRNEIFVIQGGSGISFFVHAKPEKITMTATAI